MKYFVCTIFLFCCYSMHGQSQPVPGTDTSQFPYWVEMMNHPEVNLFQTQRAFNLYWKDRKITKGCGYKVFKRWEYMAKLHADEQGNIHMPKPLPDQIQTSGIQKDPFFETGYSELMSFDSAVSCYNDSFWTEMGPRDMTDAGRINAIAFHPKDSNTMLCGAAAGGLWKTTDGGANWFLLLDSLKTLGVSSIAYDYSNPNIIYIGTGDKDGNDALGYGIFKSINGGLSWFAINKGIPLGATVVKIILDPKNPNNLLIVSDQGLYRSNDKGKTWNKSGFNVGGTKADIVFNPKYPNIVYMSAGNGFYKSTDSGWSFKKITKGLVTWGSVSAIAVSPADSSCVYMLLCNSDTYVGLYRSLSFGDSFTQMSTSPNIMGYESNGSDNSGQAYYDRDIAVNPLNRDEVFVGGINVWRSVNGGANWTLSGHWSANKAPYIHADVHSLEFPPGKKVLYATNDGGVFKLVNSNIWVKLSKGLGVRMTYRLSTCKEGRMMAGFQDNGTAYTTALDSKSFISGSGGDGMDNCFDSKNPDIFYSSIYFGTIYQNGYELAGTGLNGITEDGDWITPFTLQENNPNMMLAGYQNIWRSTTINSHTAVSFKNICDANSSVSNLFVCDVESSPANNKIFYFARTNGTLFKTSDVNAVNPSWVNLTSKRPQTGTVRDIQCHYKDTNILYIAIENKIYKSVTGGNSWIDYTIGLPDVAVYSLAIDSSDKNEALYCGTSSGVYYIDTLLKKWVRYKTNFPKNVKVLDLKISFGKNLKSSSRIFAGTYGRGIWSAPLKNYKDELPYAKIGILGLRDIISEVIYDYNRACPGGRIVFLDSSEGFSLKHKWTVTPNKGVTFENNDSTNVKAAILFSLPGKYKVTKVVKNCVGTDTSSYDDVLIFEAGVKSVCHGTTTQVQYAGDFGITHLTLNGTSGNSKKTSLGGEYQDNYCKTIFKVRPDSKYLFFTSVNSNAKEYFKAYIDYNNDGSFSETSEVIKTAYFKGMLMDSLYISGKSVKNKLLRMRLISDYMPLDTNACPTLMFGHTVDFGIVIEAEDVQKFSVDKTKACLLSKIKFTDSSSGIYSSYEWDFGKDAHPATATGIGPHNVYYTSAGYKSAQLLIDNKYKVTKDSLLVIEPRFKNTIYLPVNDSVLCSGEELTINSQLDSLSGFKYQWTLNGKYSGNINKNYNHKNVVLIDSGIYALYTQNNCYTDTSNAILVKIEKLPDATFTTTFLSKYDYQLKPNKLNYKNYLWRFGDGQNSSVVTPVHNFNTANKYKVTLLVKTANDCTDSSSILLDVKKNTHVNDATITNVLVSPNPVRDNLFIQFSLLRAEFISIEILQTDGRFVHSLYSGFVDGKTFESTYDIHQYGLSAGAYLVNIKVNNQDHIYKIMVL